MYIYSYNAIKEGKDKIKIYCKEFGLCIIYVVIVFG